MKLLWTWKGEFFGYKVDDDLFTKEGKHIGRIFDQEIYDKDGYYLGEIMDGRLITNINKLIKNVQCLSIIG